MYIRDLTTLSVKRCHTQSIDNIQHKTLIPFPFHSKGHDMTELEEYNS